MVDKTIKKLKHLLIISPYFPPVNAADMHRVRTGLPYFNENGWSAEVVTVDPAYTDMGRDELLLQSIPGDVKVHMVKAFSKRLTGKVGLGSLALRSLCFYRKYVNHLLKTRHFDLIYFSTTQFPVCILGAYWQKKFNIPYVIDMQDPWYSDYYQDKPKDQQPAKYWFSYRLNKYLEPRAITQVSGLISVSENYITDLKERYPAIANVPSAAITFGQFEPDMAIAVQHQGYFKPLLNPQDINVVYIGRGGADMHRAITPVFKALSGCLQHDPENFKRLKFYFIGTSYAPAGQGKHSILPLAKQYNLQDNVIEITDRISYYHTLVTLQQATAFFMPGSDDARYTASKIYPYLLAKKPLLALFNGESSAIGILKEFGITTVYDYEKVSMQDITDFFDSLLNPIPTPQQLPGDAVKKHSAQTKTILQCNLFEQAIQYAKH